MDPHENKNFSCQAISFPNLCYRLFHKFIKKPQSLSALNRKNEQHERDILRNLPGYTTSKIL